MHLLASARCLASHACTNNEPGVSGDGLELYKVHVHTNLQLDATGWHLRRYEHLSLQVQRLRHFCYHEERYFIFLITDFGFQIVFPWLW